MAKNNSTIAAASFMIIMALSANAFVPCAFAEENNAPAAEQSAEAGKEKKTTAETGEAADKGKKEKKHKGGWNGQWPMSKKKSKDETASEKAPADQQEVNKENGEEPEIKSSSKKSESRIKKADETKEAKEEKKDEKAQDPNRPFSPQAIHEYNQGVELQQQGFLNQAIQKYKSALSADDRIERAYCNLGLIYIAQRNFSKASDAFKKALALKPTNPYSLNGMGSVFYSKGKVQDAMEKWQKAVEVDSNFFSAFFNMANAWKNEHELDKALDNYVMTIKTNPNMAEAYYEIGVIFNKQKHPAQAQTMLAKALQLAPEGDFVADAKRQLSGIENAMGKDESEGEVKMSIVAPPAPKEPTREASTEESSK